MLENKLFTVNQIAQALEMHPKTIRRYIREGVLNANKVGGRWRVSEKNMKEFINGTEGTKVMEEKHDEWQKNLKKFIDGEYSAFEDSVQSVSIVDIYYNKEKDIEVVKNKLTQMMNTPDSDRKNVKFEFKLLEGKKARFVIWSNPKFSAKVLNKIADLTSDLELDVE